MKNCDTCIYFIKYNFQDGRKGICEYTDYNIKNMKGKSCEYYKPKKYKRQPNYGVSCKNAYTKL